MGGDFGGVAFQGFLLFDCFFMGVSDELYIIRSTRLMMAMIQVGLRPSSTANVHYKNTYHFATRYRIHLTSQTPVITARDSSMTTSTSISRLIGLDPVLALTRSDLYD